VLPHRGKDLEVPEWEISISTLSIFYNGVSGSRVCRFDEHFGSGTNAVAVSPIRVQSIDHKLPLG
jgi:hypothetical protein